jgi:hypothetical protein
MMQLGRPTTTYSRTSPNGRINTQTIAERPHRCVSLTREDRAIGAVAMGFRVERSPAVAHAAAVLAGGAKAGV